MSIHVFRPPGLLPGYVAIIDGQSPRGVPYFFEPCSGESQWNVPRAENIQVPQSQSKSAAASREELIKLLHDINSSSTIKRALSAANGRGPASVVEVKKEGDVSNEWVRHNSEHPLTAARRKLDRKIITVSEYQHICRTHKQMENDERSLVKSGSLMKRGRRTGMWFKRWFELTTDLEFSCSKSMESAEHPSSVFDLSSALCTPATVDSRHAIRIQDLHDGDEMVVAASSLKEQILWVEAIVQLKKAKGLGGHINIIKAETALEELRAKLEEQDLR